MLVVLLLIYVLRLYYAGYAPKIFLVAVAHSVPVSQIIKRVLARRHVNRWEAFLHLRTLDLLARASLAVAARSRGTGPEASEIASSAYWASIPLV